MTWLALARDVTGDEKATWWERAADAWPDCASYQAKTDRQNPAFVIEAIEKQATPARGVI